MNTEVIHVPKLLIVMLLAAMLLSNAGCGSAQPPAAKPRAPGAPPAEPNPPDDPKTTDLVIYSGRREAQIQPAVDLFQQRTGIKVVIKSGGAAELANLELEKKSNPKADIYLSNDAGALEPLRLRGAFEVQGSWHRHDFSGPQIA